MSCPIPVMNKLAKKGVEKMIDNTDYMGKKYETVEDEIKRLRKELRAVAESHRGMILKHLEIFDKIKKLISDNTLRPVDRILEIKKLLEE